MLRILKKQKGSFFNLLFIGFLFLQMGCQADPSAYKLPVPDVEKVQKSYGETFNPAVDILFIIDDSGSMQSIQEQLSNNAALFINQFFNAKFIDYHIGVTTSSPSYFGGSGKLKSVNGIKYVDRYSINGEDTLAQMFEVGTNGSAVEEFFSVIQDALGENAKKTYNKDFLRDNAQLAVFVVTDTEDQSKFKPENTYEFLLNLKKGDYRKIHFAGAIVTIEKEKCIGESDQGVPYKLRKLVSLFQSRGYRFNVCKSNFGSDLAKVATEIVNSVSTIYLDNLPDVRSIEVRYGNELLPNNSMGWLYDNNINGIHLSPNIDLGIGNGESINLSYEEIYKLEEVK
jgi:hypothetical protein